MRHDSRPKAAQPELHRPAFRQGFRRMAAGAGLAAVVIVAHLFVFVGSGWAQPDSSPPLVVGSETDYPPFATGKTDEQAGGFTVDLWKAVAAENNLQYTIRVGPFRQILEDFRAGKIDVMINLAQSEERRAFADFSVPHVVVHGAIFVRKGDSVIRSEADFAGKSIIVIHADLAHDYAVSKGWGSQLVLVDSAASGLRLLASGKYDAMLLSKLAGLQTLQAEKIRDVVALPAKAGFSQRFSFAVRKGNSELLAKINEGLALSKSSGTYDALYEKWFGVFDARELTMRQVLSYAGVVAFGLSLFGGYLLVRRHERDKVEARLRDNEERLRLAMSAAQQGLYDLNVQTGECIVSPEYALMLGYDPGEFRESNAAWRERLHPDDREPVYTAYSDYVAGRTDQYRVEFRQRTKDGRWIWVLSLGSVVARDADGRPLRMLGTHTDITERKHSEARNAAERGVLELLVAGASLRDVLDFLTRSYNENFPGMLTSVLLLDSDGKRLRTSSAPGLPPSFSEAIDGAEIGPAVGACGTAAYTRRTTVAADISSDPLWKDYRDLALSHGLRACWSVPLISSNDRVLGTLAVYFREPKPAQPAVLAALERGAHFAALAIERHQLLGSLQHSEGRFQTLTENAPILIYLTDEKGDCIYVNRRWCEASGLTPEEALGKGWLNALHEDDRSTIAERWHQFVEGGGTWALEYRLKNGAGAVTWVYGTAAAIQAPGGKIVGYVGTNTDITERRQAEIEREHLNLKLQETQKLESLGVLAGGIAHDFNNLLSAILGNASIAAIELPPGSSVQDCIEQITEASLRAADLCKQMLAYSGRGRFVVQKLDLGELVEQTAQMLQISISKKAVLRFRLEKGLPPVEVDATQIRQVAMNLVINASEAIGDKSGVISLSTGLTRVDRDYLRGTLMDPDLPEGDYVFLEVSDSGCGMNPATLARIFDPFFTTKFTGRGLGLAAVLGIVRGHRGALKVYSEVGRGTTFKLLFPAATGPTDHATAEPAATPQWQGQGTVLVVDDEETMRSTVARMMRILGLEPLLVSDGREAVEVFRADPNRFVLVLLDLTMPHMDGEQTFAELRRLRPDVRVVLMSGFNAHEALMRFSGKGLADFLQKPFTLAALRTVLRDVLK